MVQPHPLILSDKCYFNIIIFLETNSSLPNVSFENCDLSFFEVSLTVTSKLNSQ